MSFRKLVYDIIINNNNKVVSMNTKCSQNMFRIKAVFLRDGADKIFHGALCEVNCMIISITVVVPCLLKLDIETGSYKRIRKENSGNKITRLGRRSGTTPPMSEVISRVQILLHISFCYLITLSRRAVILFSSIIKGM